MPTQNSANAREPAGARAGSLVATAARSRRAGGPALAIVDHLSVAVLVSDREGRCTFMNRCAVELLASSDGVRLVAGEHLGAEYPGDAHKLRTAIQRACDDRIGCAIMINRSGDPQPLISVVSPFDDRTDTRPQAMLMLRRAGIRNEVVANHLRSLFRLSPAEAEIAVSLATGAELTEIAGARKVTVNTLRSQIASVMGKTGTRRQAELVALVSKLDTILG